MKTINELIEEVFQIRLAYNKIDVPAETWKDWKKRYKRGEMKDKTKRDILEKFGFKKVQDEMWE